MFTSCEPCPGNKNVTGARLPSKRALATREESLDSIASTASAVDWQTAMRRQANSARPVCRVKATLARSIRDCLARTATDFASKSPMRSPSLRRSPAGAKHAKGVVSLSAEPLRRSRVHSFRRTQRRDASSARSAASSPWPQSRVHEKTDCPRSRTRGLAQGS